MADTKALRKSPSPDPSPRASTSTTAPHDDDAEPPAATSERTPLLSVGEPRDFGANGSHAAPIGVSHSHSHHHHHHHHHHSGDGEGFDPSSEADLYLARSFSSIPSGLAPEVMESAMLLNRSQSGDSSGRRLSHVVHDEQHGGRPNLDSVIAGEPGSVLFEEASSSLSSSSNSSNSGNDYGDRDVDVDNIDIESGPLLVTVSNGNGSSNGNSNGDAKKHHHHHNPQQPQKREFLIDTDHRRFWAIFIGIMATYFLACFDGTIMASSHPVITSYFRSSNSASWLSTAFLLTNTAFQPMVGRLSDSLGRRAPYLVTMAIFGVATLWCALAQSMTSFIVARAVCGLGAGGMMALGNILGAYLYFPFFSSSAFFGSFLFVFLIWS